MKQLVCMTAVCLIFGLGVAGAESISIDANVNDSVLDASIIGEWAVDPNYLRISPFITYDDDDYILAGADVALTSEFRGDKDIRIGMGLRGFWGEAEAEVGDATAEIAGIGIQLLGRYDFSSSIRAPLEIGAQITGALSPMTFLDADGYLEIETTVGLYILQDKLGMIYTGYRYLGIGFDSEVDIEDLDKHEVFGGIRFSF